MECNKKPQNECIPPGCKWVDGKKRKYCRTAKNKKRTQKNGTQKKKSSQPQGHAAAAAPPTQQPAQPTLKGRRKHCRLPEGYIYVSPLGKPGKDGETWRVRNTRNGKEYACKIFKKTKSKKLIQKEVEYQSRLNKKGVAPNVIWSSDLCFIMDLVEGVPFKDVMKKMKLTKRDINQWIKICKVLAENGIAYNDGNLKLNLMYNTNKKKWVLIDYGMILPESKIPRNAKKGEARTRFLYSYNLRLFLRNAESPINKYAHKQKYYYTPLGGGFMPKKSYPTLLHEIAKLGDLDAVLEFQNGKRHRENNERLEKYDKRQMIGV